MRPRPCAASSSLTQGITELRNQVGTGHGCETIPTWVRPRHARLAAGSAQTGCQLMQETLEDPEAPWRATDPAEKDIRPTRESTRAGVAAQHVA